MLASGRKVNFGVHEEKTAINIAREKWKEKKQDLETEEIFQKRSKIYGNIVELIESFKRNPNETIAKLKVKLGSAGINFLFLFSFLLFFLIFFFFSKRY